jgi:hypothetical protein
MPQIKKEYAEKSCKWCGKTWKPTNFAENRKLACSAECRLILTSKGNIPRSTLVLPTCEVCERQFKPHPSRPFDQPKTCSHKCAALRRMRDPVAKQKLAEFMRNIPQPTPERRKEIGAKRRGSNNPAWKGGRLQRPDQYIHISRELVPNWLKCMSAYQGYVREHRLIMAMRIGRPLDSREVVHHVDGDTTNNNITNLELWPTNGSHIKHENGNIAENAACAIGNPALQILTPSFI